MGSVYEIELAHPQQAVLVAMADHAQDDGTDVYPSIARLAWKTGYSDRQIKRIIKDLLGVGVLIEVTAATQHRPTEYVIFLDGGTQKPPFKLRGDKTPRGDKTGIPGVTKPSPRGDIAASPEPSGNHQGEPPLSSPPTVRSQTTEEIETAWGTYVVEIKPRGRGRDLQPDDRKILRDVLKVADLVEVETAIRECQASDFHQKRGKHKNRPGGKYNSLGKIFKPRPTKGETWRSRIEWWLDRAEERQGGPSSVSPMDFMNAEAKRIREEQERGD